MACAREPNPVDGSAGTAVMVEGTALLEFDWANRPIFGAIVHPPTCDLHVKTTKM
jgi:hypothetical protein